jgi:lipopolysaccharide exporter
VTNPLRGLAGLVWAPLESFGLSLKGRVGNSTYARNSGRIVIGNVIAQLVSLVSMPILSRMYGPTLFGEYGVFSATANLINGFACLGLISAIVSPKEEEEASAIYRICILSVVSISTLVVGACIALSPFFQVIHVARNYTLIMVMMGVFLIVSNWATAAYTYAMRQKAYRLLSFNPIIASVANLATAAPLALTGFASYGLLAGAVISQAAVLINLLFGFRRVRFAHHPRALLRVLRKYKAFPLFQMPSGLIAGMGSQLPVLMISAFFGTSFLGQYSMAQRLLYLPVNLVAGAMGQVHFQQSSELMNNDQSIDVLTYRVVRFVTLFSFFPLLLLAVFGRVVLQGLLGPQWGLAGTIAQIRTIELFFTIGMFSVSYVFVVLKKQQLNLIYNILVLVTNILVFVVAGALSSSGLVLVVALSLSSALMNALFLAVALRAVGIPLARFFGLSLLGCAVLAIGAVTSILAGGAV